MTNPFTPNGELERLLISTGAVKHCINPPHDPHFELSSGMHTGFYINCDALYANDLLLRRIAGMFLSNLPADQVRRVQCVAVPSPRVAPLARIVADALCDGNMVSLDNADPNCPHATRLERRAQDRVYRMRTLLIDDVITSGRTIAHLAALIREQRGWVFPVAMAIVSRAQTEVVQGLTVHALLRKRSRVWHAGNCPLCAVGSLATRGHG